MSAVVTLAVLALPALVIHVCDFSPPDPTMWGENFDEPVFTALEEQAAFDRAEVLIGQNPVLLDLTGDGNGRRIMVANHLPPDDMRAAYQTFAVHRWTGRCFGNRPLRRWCP